jgi:endonuclease/exonuclease/phosphatase family metal-dependent hydrolase
MKEATMHQLTVMTYNLLSPGHADWRRRREVIRAALPDRQSDVVALQECVHSRDYDEAADLLGEQYETVWHPGRSADGVGAVLASRFPLGELRTVDLHVTERVTLPWAAAVLAEIELAPPLGTVVVAHHKPTYEIGYSRERELQAVAAASAIARQVAGRDLHVVVLGDFDDTPDSASLRFSTGGQSLEGISVAYRDAWEAKHGSAPGHTFAADNPLVQAGEMALDLGQRIDYVLVRCGVHGPTLDVVECDRVLDKPTQEKIINPNASPVRASTHFCVVVRV